MEFRENRYVTKLPWKLDHDQLPTTFSIAKSRTENLIRRLSKEPVMLQVHGMIIKDQENKEFVEKIENKKKKQYQSITLYSSSPSEERLKYNTD